ncbi:1-acyl-sn-glycerol-3-phosphate acyltransferase [Streptomyces sp. NBC_00878]|uniref:lysophospholipid acyltransferase family protein n=1 Tax=Streptomyces sp. NBC_00878 TaxID=2975854 RepID=UPI00224D5A10|nr:lysophospholipid acyltransferase family protein [Streptomyces sp. NBC_00878]MCX4904386.1 1-acyl-sn-glycerol-3-phosphate acyltransferase [Streptomyces sp. NBC_00878]
MSVPVDSAHGASSHRVPANAPVPTSFWLPSAPCTPALCVSDPGPSVARPLRAARLVTGLAVIAFGVSLIPLIRRLSRPLRDRLIRRWCRTILAAFGVRATITEGGGEEGKGREGGEGGEGGEMARQERAARPTRPATGMLVVANHASWLDIPLIAAVLPGRMVAKQEIASYPVLGQVAAYGGTLFVERDRLRALPAKVDELSAALRAGSSVIVFPEGTTWCGREHGPFRHAAFQAAIDASVPVRPVSIRYRLQDRRFAEAAAFVGKDTLLASLRRVAAVRGLTAELTVLPPIAPGTHNDRRALARAAHEAAVSRRTPRRPGT